ncbi:hypothetical protein, partial [Paenibacillus sp. AR247]|uniref:hypothetical protein n=1 Tax=Paenibacillus sp. AR247 TaxID=1631599 RepID=UPI001C6112ED
SYNDSILGLGVDHIALAMETGWIDIPLFMHRASIHLFISACTSIRFFSGCALRYSRHSGWRLSLPHADS